jgi:hypothetical protein
MRVPILACFSAHENASYIAILPLVAAMYVLPLLLRHLSVMLHFAPAWKPEYSQPSYNLFFLCQLLISIPEK